MRIVRDVNHATLLHSGKVLVEGGSGDVTAELYDPLTGTFSVTGSMTAVRGFETATLLNDGTVLVTGGYPGLASAELYTPPPIPVAIEIKPPATPPVSINLSSAGVIPVAILSSATFDATQVNQGTISLSGSAVKLKGSNQYQCSVQDFNGDAINDLLCQVVTDQTQLQPGSTVATLTAQTLSGQNIQGQEAIVIVNQ